MRRPVSRRSLAPWLWALAAALVLASSPALSQDEAEKIDLLVASNLGEAIAALGWEQGSALVESEFEKALERIRQEAGGVDPLLVDLGGFAAPELTPIWATQAILPVETPYSFGAAPIFHARSFAAVAVGLRDLSLGTALLGRAEMGAAGPVPLIGGLRTEDGFSVAGEVDAATLGPPSLAFESLGAEPLAAIFGDFYSQFSRPSPDQLFEWADEEDVRVLLVETLGANKLPTFRAAEAALTLARTGREPGVRLLDDGGVVEFGRGPLLARVSLGRSDPDAPWRAVEAVELWRPQELPRPTSVSFYAGDFSAKDIALPFEKEVASLSLSRLYLEPEDEALFGDQGISIAEVVFADSPEVFRVARLDATQPSGEPWSIWLKISEEGSNLELRGGGSIRFGIYEIRARAIAELLSEAAAENRLDAPLEIEQLLVRSPLDQLRRGVKAFRELF
jgi:hypothetical protein